jgi:hypothetical protein
MKRITALSFAIATLFISHTPALAIPVDDLVNGMREAMEHAPKKAVQEGAENAANQIDDAVKGLAKEPEMIPSNPMPGGSDTPTQILEQGARDADLADPSGAIKGAPETPPEAATDEIAPAAGSSAAVGAATSLSAEQDASGIALPAAGVAAVAVTYGLYRVVKSRR